MIPSSRHGILLYVAIVLGYCFLYEWVNIFSISDINTYVHVLKFAIPLSLLKAVNPLSSLNVSAPQKYFLYFALFMIWSLVPNLLSGHMHETMVQWLKFIPRMLFCYLIFLYLLQQPAANTLLMKGIVIIAACTVFQYFVLASAYYPGDSTGFSLPIAQKTTYFGPYGLAGDGNAFLAFENLNLNIFRLTGFWFEPSSASAFLFMTFFLAKALTEQTQQQRWKLLGILCLVGGLLTFSNAGQVALASALLCGCILRFSRLDYKFIIKVAVLLIWIFLAVFGRGLIPENSPKHTVLTNLAGVRDSVHDPYGGRIEQTANNIKSILKRPVGIGFRIIGIDSEGRGVKYSASAFLLWMLSAGWIGGFLLIMREIQVGGLICKRPLLAQSINIFQAWAVLFFHHLAFGTWMTPLYFLLVAMVFSSVYSRSHAPLTAGAVAV